jgi:hypothetical protein
MPFLPQENSRASLLADLVRSIDEQGTMISYSDIFDLFDMDDKPVDQAQPFLSSVVAKANQRLHRDGDWRHLQNVPTVGYRVASPAGLRDEVMARQRSAQRTMIAALRASEKVIRHPNASVLERRQATDAVTAQAALLTMVRREQRKIRNAWPADERSPVVNIDDD